MRHGSANRQPLARFDAQSAATNARLAAFFSGIGLIGLVRWISWGGGRGRFESGFLIGAALVALTISGLLVWSARHITTHLDRDMDYWRQLEARNRPRVKRGLVLGCAAMSAITVVAFVVHQPFWAGLIGAWACATGAMVIAWFTGGVRPSRFEA
jgi:hypothetical protein